MTEAFDWKTVVDPQKILDEAIHRLLSGQVLEFPTESGPVALASAQHLPALERLELPLQIAVPDGHQARQWCPKMPSLSRRLIRRFWPGSLILGFPAHQGQDRMRLFRTEIQDRLIHDSQLFLRCPDHEAFRELQDRFPGILVLGRSNSIDWKLTDSGIQQVLQLTRVSVDNNGYRVLQEGSIRPEMIEEQAIVRIVFVCTGNTCRSAMAEALFKRLLSERLGCSMEELEKNGYQILSAGLAAHPGYPAAEQACVVVKKYGSTLDHHQSRFLDPELASEVDYLIAMTRNHTQTLLHYYPDLGCKPQLLSISGQDINDPIGQGMEVYEACCQEILESLRVWEEKILED